MFYSCFTQQQKLEFKCFISNTNTFNIIFDWQNWKLCEDLYLALLIFTTVTICVNVLNNNAQQVGRKNRWPGKCFAIWSQMNMNFQFLRKLLHHSTFIYESIGVDFGNLQSYEVEWWRSFLRNWKVIFTGDHMAKHLPVHRFFFHLDEHCYSNHSVSEGCQTKRFWWYKGKNVSGNFLPYINSFFP